MISNILWRDQARFFLKDKSESKLERDQDETESLGAFSLETKTRPRVSSFIGVQSNSFLFDGTLPSYNFLFDGTVLFKVEVV